MRYQPARRLLAAGLLGLLLSACAAGPARPAAPAPTAGSTALPTAPAPTAAPTAAPTVTPEAETALPRPLYLINDGQIERIEADGVTRAVLTAEPANETGLAPISDLVVSAADGALIYVVQRGDSFLLLRAGPRAESPTTLFERTGVVIANLVIAPDGANLAAHLGGPAMTQPEMPAGLYLIPTAGGAPRLIVADDQITNPTEVSDTLFGYSGVAFSPDGARLLVNRYGMQLEVCDLAVVTIADGAVTPLQEPPPAPAGERASTCGAGAWTPDSSGFYFLSQRVGAPLGGAALYLADAATGAVRPITPARESGPLTLYAAPFVAEDGALYALTATVDALPALFGEQTEPLGLTISRVDPATGALQELRPLGRFNPYVARWDAAGRGLVALRPVADSGLTLDWLPVSGEPRTIFGPTGYLYTVAWAAR